MSIDYRSLGLSFLWTLLAIPALGQAVVTDNTVGSVVTTNNGLLTITEGTVRSDGINATLLHSFETFSPGATNVSFDLRTSQNALDTSTVTAIIGRITGSDSSFINGQLSIQQDGGTPTADLFLINPNGITFGSNASLLLPGSFFASTAESVLFENGLSFSSLTSGAAPMLTVSSPIGLQLGNNPGVIQVTDLGQTIITNSDPTSFITSPSIRIPGSSATLDVSNGKTIGLIGGNVTLQGSSVRANNGRIELGGVSHGTVGLQPDGTGWSLDYTETTADGAVVLTSKSALDASGLTSQGMQIVGGQVIVQDGSVALMQVFGDAPMAMLDITATDRVEVTGIDPVSGLASAVGIENLGSGIVGAVNIQTRDLRLLDGANIGSVQVGSNVGSDVNLVLSNQLVVSGNSPFRNSLLGTGAFGTGDGGNLNISSRVARIENGGAIGSLGILSSGDSGDVTLNVADSIEVVGNDSTGEFSSSINSSSLGSGDAGRIVINTAQLSLRDGGDIESSTLVTGNAGEIIINATEFVELVGAVDFVDQLNNPQVIIIDSAALRSDNLRTLLGLPDTLSGDSGTVTINTPRLSLSGPRHQISTINNGSGAAGDLQINASILELSDGAFLSGGTTSGEGGNIDITLEDLLVLRNGARIEATAVGTGNGGNISIQAPFVIAVPRENSDIIANALAGRGGNVTITAQGVLGLTFRNQLTSDNDITASSQFGINGAVEIKISEASINLNSGLVEFPETLADASGQVDQDCVSGNSRFIVTGRGGVPTNPTEILSRYVTWTDTRELTPFFNNSQAELSNAPMDTLVDSVLKEANVWYPNEFGQIELVAANVTLPLGSQATCVGPSS